ncbi:unnamed protein product [Ambrosiozyma monospora]|uniref:Unnamed protein product n=1 Tax=Ambrosiozyma monospora TaxID=43982 RepID=A0ACB5TB96_AMBMO|nr:unnamed protein product [Ambrosiozyma monospora]
MIWTLNWLKVSGSTGKDLAKQFKEQEITLVGHRDTNVAKELNKILPVASTTGAVALSSVIGLAETSGLSSGFALGTSVGVLSSLAVLESLMTDWQQSGGASSQFAQVFNPNQ